MPLILRSIEDDKIGVHLVNSYSLHRKPNRAWELIIFYARKIKKGDKRDTRISLGIDNKLITPASEAIEELIERAAKISILDKIQPEPEPKEGW